MMRQNKNSQNIRKKMTAQPHMIPYGPVWVPYRTLWAPYEASVDPLWSCMDQLQASNGPLWPIWPIWPPLAFIWLPQGVIWANRNPFNGPYGPIMATYSS